MSINPHAYLSAAYPPPLRPPDVRDEDVAYALDTHAKRSQAARKAGETRRRRTLSKTTAPTERGE